MARLVMPGSSEEAVYLDFPPKSGLGARVVGRFYDLEHFCGVIMLDCIILYLLWVVYDEFLHGAKTGSDVPSKINQLKT